MRREGASDTGDDASLYTAHYTRAVRALWLPCVAGHVPLQSARATNAEELDLYAQNRTTYQRATMISLRKSHRAAPKVILGTVQLSMAPCALWLCTAHTEARAKYM